MPFTPRVLRLMAFVDGENLVGRFQAMISEGRTQRRGVQHSTDEYVWHGEVGISGVYEAVRAYYYASVVGDDDRVAAATDKIKEWRFGQQAVNPFQCRMYPRVFKKSRKSQKSTTVDVRLAVDALSHGFQDNLDVALIVTGDADFCPVVDELQSRGKRVFIAALSSGLSVQLVRSADEYFPLDKFFFEDSQ